MSDSKSEPKLRVAVTDNCRAVMRARSQYLGRREIEELSTDFGIYLGRRAGRAYMLCAAASLATTRALLAGLEPCQVRVELHGDLPELQSILLTLGFQVEVFDHPGAWYEEQLASLADSPNE